VDSRNRHRSRPFSHPGRAAKAYFPRAAGVTERMGPGLVQGLAWVRRTWVPLLSFPVKQWGAPTARC
jgi:hypothetical protein